MYHPSHNFNTGNITSGSERDFVIFCSSCVENFTLKNLDITLNQGGPLDFEDPRNRGSRLRGGALDPPRSRLGVTSSKLSSPRLASF